MASFKQRLLSSGAKPSKNVEDRRVPKNATTKRMVDKTPIPYQDDQKTRRVNEETNTLRDLVPEHVSKDLKNKKIESQKLDTSAATKSSRKRPETLKVRNTQVTPGEWKTESKK